MALDIKESFRVQMVLMWKHMVVRRRKCLLTFFELFLTCAMMVILYVLKIYVIRPEIMNLPLTTTAAPGRMLRSDAVELDSLIGPERIFYTPDNNLTSSLMSVVGRNLKLKRLKKFPGPTHYGYLAIKNETELAHFYNNMTFFDALLIFQDMDNETLPGKLSYTIRVKNNNYHTETYEPNSLTELPNPKSAQQGLNLATRHEMFGKVYEPFLRLQWAVDSSYLQLKTGKLIDKKVLLREMPYQEIAQGELLVHVVMVLATLMLAMSGLMFNFINIITNTVAERASGVQELMKISGASTVMVYISHILNSMVMGVPFAIISTIVLCIDEHPIIDHFSPFMLFILLIFYVLSIISFGLAIGGFLKSAAHANSIAVVVYILAFIAVIALDGINFDNFALFFLVGLLPHMPLLRFINLSVAFANIDWLYWDRAVGSGNILMVYVCLLAQSALFFLVAWYLYNVHPGRYGVALPWNFIFMKDYWLRRKRLDEGLIEMQGTTAQRDPRYFEPIRPDEHVGIQINNLTKVYKSLGKQPVVALNDVNIQVCKAGITVLLGHNGAGKTTLIDIITGMQSATSGEIYVNGHHFTWGRAAIRKQLGYCPQKNLLFPDLNVHEHVMFFSMLRGESRKNARLEARKILTDMDLLDKASAVPSLLSGGMSRRLQIGCALAGHTTVLLLDEPTSSLDVRSRRSLWDVLLAMRGSCTILISTHFLEEADALGARVCALRRGHLTCDASPLHLKRSMGEGYYISIGGGNEKLEPAIFGIIPNAYLHRLTPTSVTYALPYSETSKMSQLFTELEARRGELGIISMGVSPPSLDQVFLKLCYDGTVDSYDEVDRTNFFLGADIKVKGFRLWWRQFTVLLKRFLHFVRRSIVLTALYVLLPLAFIILIIWSSNKSVAGNTATSSGDSRARKNAARTIDDVLNPLRDMSLLIYNRLPHVKVMYNLDDNYARSLQELADGVDLVRSHDVYEDARRQLEENERNYENNLMGVEVNDTTAQVLYSTAYRHIAPVALNLVSNMIARQTMTNATDSALRTVTTFNQPITTHENVFLRTSVVQPKETKLITECAAQLALVAMVILTFFNAPLKVEGRSGARSNYLRAGVSHTLYWCATLLIHLAMFLIVFVPIYVTAVAVFDYDDTLNNKEFLATLAVILTVSAAAVLVFQYYLVIGLHSVFSIIYFMLLVMYSQFIVPAIMDHRINRISSPDSKLNTFLNYAQVSVWITPINHVSFAMTSAAYVARLNAYCRLNKGMCPAIPPGDPGFSVAQCCESSSNSYLGYFSSFPVSPIYELGVLVVLILVYMTLVVLTSRGVFNRCCTKLYAYGYKNQVSPEQDNDTVSAERDYVVKQINSVKDTVTDSERDALLMHDVHKVYHTGVWGRAVPALRGINLSVRQGECFGILGVNGAGKTTAFTVIAGEQAPTRGLLYASGNSLSTQRKKYMQCVAYCQQYMGVDGFLTGRQCLEYLLTVSGYKPDIVKSETKSWLQCVDMELYADKKVDSYSGGCGRRLAAAVALCGARPLVLLDEPSSGVDTAARHKLWRAVTRSLGYSAVVLTSHSMDEMEALCARMALVRGGRVHALGDAHALRHAHGDGHALTLRLAHQGEHSPGASATRDDLVTKLKEDVHRNFDCTLRSEISNQLDYHINATMSYSEIFTKLETLKRTHAAILDDYCVNDTTLEEVFLAFAAGEDVAKKKTV